MKNNRLIQTLVCIFIVFSPSAFAQLTSAPTTYNSRSAFDSATGETFIETFDGALVGLLASGTTNATVAFRDFTVTVVPESDTVSVFSVPNGISSRLGNTGTGNSNFSGEYIGWQGSNVGATFIFTFNEPVSSFGFDFYDGDPTDSYDLVVDGFDTTNFGDGATFFGISSGAETFTQVTFRQTAAGGAVEGFGFDNFTYTSANFGDEPPDGGPQINPPTAVAGSDIEVTDDNNNGSETVQLDGSASTDSNGTIVIYTWSWSGGSASGATPTVTLPVGVTTVTLTVTDDEAQTDTDTLTVTVIGTNDPPVANAGPNIVVYDQDNTGSELIQLDGSSSSDVDGSIVEYEWRYDLGGFQFIYGETQQVTLPIGNYAIRLKVTDNSGATSTDFVSVGVRPATFTVNFSLDGKGTRTGGGALGQSVEINNAAAAPVVTANAGWIFDGWDVSFDNITSNLTVTAQYLIDVDNTQPDQDVELSEERTGGSSSDLATTFEANSLSLGDGADFTLGPNEVLDLNGGDLVIEEGAVFSGNGTILGNVFNSGLLRIPVVKVGMVLPQISNEGFVAIERPERTKAPAKVEAPIDNDGTFSTDASLEVTGTFTQTATGTLRLFAEGEEPGVSFSQLIVGDTVTLDGEIQLVLDQAEYGLFTLNPGDTFDVVVINQDVTGKVITIQPGLGYRILAADAIKTQTDIAALSPTPYTPTQANDPDVLVELPSGLFTFTLVENDTVLRATYQGTTPLPTPTTGDIEITSLIPSIDTDPASDSWETQNGFDPAVNDMLTLDSDGDGDPDIRELFQGTGKNSGGEQFGFKGTQGNPATQTLSTQFRRSTESTVMNEIEGVNQWSTDLVNWYESGESNGNVVVTFTEQQTNMGTYEIVDVDVTVTNGQTPTLYYRLDFRAKE